MKFNSGTLNYEPDLPLKNKKSKTTEKIKISFWKILLLFLLAIFIVGLFYFLIRI